MTNSRQPTATGVAEAAAKIEAILPATPLLPIEIDGGTIQCKAETLQPVGAFKIRGAWHRLTALTARERERGVVGVSSGNHAQGVAWAARRLGIRASIVMPADAPRVKLDATRALGADVVIYDRAGGEDRDEVAAQLVSESGATLVHAFADPWVIEGQGTCGTEIVRQMRARRLSGPTRIVAPCGGGGLSAGLALACPESEIVPVEPEGWDTVRRSLAAGKVVPVAPDAPPTPCDALQPPATRDINLDVLRSRVTRTAVVSPDEVRAAQRLAFNRLHLVVEPGGAAALAAVIAGKVDDDSGTVVVLSGGNTDAVAFARVLSGSD